MMVLTQSRSKIGLWNSPTVSLLGLPQGTELSRRVLVRR